jgi:hypothetical protein
MLEASKRLALRSDIFNAPITTSLAPVLDLVTFGRRAAHRIARQHGPP